VSELCPGGDDFTYALPAAAFAWAFGGDVTDVQLMDLNAIWRRTEPPGEWLTRAVLPGNPLAQKTMPCLLGVVSIPSVKALQRPDCALGLVALANNAGGTFPTKATGGPSGGFRFSGWLRNAPG
jgi:hypothetical protein